MIANSLSITIAQRTREFATLRTLGASRRQVRFSVHHRVARDRARSRRSSGSSSASRSRRGCSGSSTPSASRCRTAACSFSTRDDRRLAARRDPRDAAREHRARRSGRRACLRSPPCARARRSHRAGSPASGRRIAALVTALGFAGLSDRALRARLDTTQSCSSCSSAMVLVFIGVALLSAPLIVRPLTGILGWPGRRVCGASPAGSPATTRTGTRSARRRPRRR